LKSGRTLAHLKRYEASFEPSCFVLRVPFLPARRLYEWKLRQLPHRVLKIHRSNW